MNLTRLTAILKPEKDALQRRLMICLLLSLLVHLGLSLTLVSVFRHQVSSGQSIPRLPTLTVEFISGRGKNMEKPSPPHRNPSADSKMISDRQKVIAHGASDFPKNVHRQSSAPTSEIDTAESYSSSNTTHPKLNLSKVLIDMRQVAREMAELNNDRKFDRRKMAVDPENLKAPNVDSSPNIESYKLPNGYQRTCRTGSDGKKHCMSKEPDDDSIWNAKIYLADPPADAKSGGEFTKRLEEAIGNH